MKNSNMIACVISNDVIQSKTVRAMKVRGSGATENRAEWRQKMNASVVVVVVGSFFFLDKKIESNSIFYVMGLEFAFWRPEVGIVCFFLGGFLFVGFPHFFQVRLSISRQLVSVAFLVASWHAGRTAAVHKFNRGGKKNELAVAPRCSQFPLPPTFLCVFFSFPSFHQSVATYFFVPEWNWTPTQPILGCFLFVAL